MIKNQQPYPIEVQLEKLIREFRLGFQKMIQFFFTIPKRKDDKMIYVIETLAWLFLTIALIWRVLE